MSLYDQIEEGYQLPELVKGPITREGIKAYARASGDYNPIHIDEKTAIKAGLGGVIAHGLNSMAFTCQMITDWLGDRGILKKIDVQFRGMVRPGDIVISRGKIVRKYIQDGNKLADIEITQISKTPVLDLNLEIKGNQVVKIHPEFHEAPLKGWLRERDVFESQILKTESIPEGTRIQIRLNRITTSILGSATVLLY